MSTVVSRRFVNSSDIELIDMALDYEYDSLTYVLASRLEANLHPDESDELKSKNDHISSLESEIDDLEHSVSMLEYKLANMAGNEEKLKEVVSRAQKAVGGALNLINPND